MEPISNNGGGLQRRKEAHKETVKPTGDVESLFRDLRERRLRRSQLSLFRDTGKTLEDSFYSDGDSIVQTTLRKKRLKTEKSLSPSPNPRLHQLREKHKLTRFDEPAIATGKNTPEDQPELGDNYSRWKNLSSQLRKAKRKTNDQDSYDFFTSSLSDSASMNISEDCDHEQDQPDNEAETDFVSDHGNEMDTLILNEDLVGFPVYIPQQERLINETDVYFRPSSLPAMRTVSPHNTEEGLYIGERPRVPWSHIIKMENRILQRNDEGSDWFGEDNNLLVQSNPLRTLHTRPYILHSDGSRHSHFQCSEVKVQCQNLIDQVSGIYQLEVDISSLHFSHHPLFSCEHVLSSQLEEVYHHQLNKDSKAVDYYDKKIYALKIKIHALKQALQDLDISSVEATEVQLHICLFRKEMHAIRQHRKNSIASDYARLKKLLRIWKELKLQRDNQGYSNTTTFLTLKKVEANIIEEEAQLKFQIEEELLEYRDEFQEQYALRSQEHLQVCGKGTPGQAEESLAHNEVSSENQHPFPLFAFDESQLRHKLSDYYRSHHKPPGEPLLIPELHHSNAVSQHCPTEEQLRREDVGRTRFYIKIFYNDQQVSQTKESNLNSDFSVYFGEIFTIQIVQWPESIKLQVFESRFLTYSLVAEVYIPIPELQQTVKSLAGTEKYHFTSNKPFTFTHSAVGSGNYLPSFHEAGILLTTGYLNAAVCWGIDDEDRVLSPEIGQKPHLSKYTDAVCTLGVAGITDLRGVKKWIEQSRLDPNDPRNAELLHLIESIPEENIFFRLINLDSDQSFITDNDFNCNKRFSMLHMRDQGHRGLKNKIIPLSSKSISGSMWKETVEYKAYADYDLPLVILGDFYSSRKEEQNKFLLDIRERVLSQIHSSNGNVMLSEVVISEFIPNISALKSTLVDLLVPRRPLKPIRRERKKRNTHNIDISDANIVVRVIRAFNVPLRENISENATRPHSLQQVYTKRRGDTAGDGGRTTSLDVNIGVVSPYVEVSYGDVVLRTASACGSNPFWNEELTIPFQPPGNDFSPANLQAITNAIHINLFDEVVIDILEDDRERATNVHHRIEKRWLGKFTLPFSTLLSRERIEGTFQLDVPLILLGYTLHQNDVSHSNPLLGFGTSEFTHIQLFISLDPPLRILPPIKDQFQSNEDISMLQHASKWLQMLREKFPKRYFTATALDISGKHVFVTRFVKPQRSPLEISSTDSSQVHLMEYLARYVSLIPFLPDAVVFSGNVNIWSTSDQFLQMLGGDEEEHAILLCNYFIYYKIKAWIILGYAVPEGTTAYVLTGNPEPDGIGYWLWNPSTGVHYDQHEAYIPLVSIGCVINESNVWANVQEFDDPSRLMFDLPNCKHWCPLFWDESKCLSSVQQDLQYSETNHERVKELEERIERSLREHIMALRSRFVTRWNRHCTRILQSILPEFEVHFSSPLNDCYNKLAEVQASYELTGFPIHVRYSDIQQLLVTIERTGIHLCENKKVEYSLAVYIHPYPNDVLSVWLYVVSMVPK